MKNPHKRHRLTKEHYEEILGVENGADVIGYWNAKLLRDIESTRPGYIKITGVKGDYDGIGQLPYFGCIATEKGVKAARKYFNRKRSK